MNLYDEQDLKEKMLSSMVFESYLKSNDLSQYNTFLNEISNNTHKSISYLRGLRDVYIHVYASSEDIKCYKNKVKEMKTVRFKHIAFCDELFSLPVEKRNDFVINSGICNSNLIEYFERYKANNGKYSNQIDGFFEQYNEYCEQLKKIKREKGALDNFKLACAYYDDLVNLGFYSIRDYILYLNDTSVQYYTRYSNASRYRKIIKDYDPESWIYYDLMMKENRAKSFFLMKDKIELFNSKLKVNSDLDIIDYYMMVGIPDDSYCHLCEGFLSNCDIVNFKKFISSYRLMNYCQFMDDDPNYMDKNVVAQFLYNNNIPFEYFNYALAKYYAGGLDQYIGRSKKIANL